MTAVDNQPPSTKVDSRTFRILKRKKASSVTELRAIKRFAESFNPTANTYAQLETRSDQINELVKEFTDAHDELEKRDDDEADLRESEKLEFKDLVCDTKAIVMELLKKQKRQPSVGTHSTSSAYMDSMRLPPVATPKFDGNWQNWSEFKDSFEAMFHKNDKLANVQKFHYLKSCLLGAAIEVVKNIPTTDENYEQAYETLVERFENQSLIIQSHIRSLFGTPKVKTPCAGELRSLHQHIMGHVNALAAMSMPVQYWDAWLVTLVSSRMDSITAGGWQLKQTTKVLPTFKDIETFLKCRVSAYEVGDYASDVMQSTQKSKDVHQHKRVLIANTEDQCSVCKGTHKIYSCATFNGMTPTERQKVVARARLCFNCLSKTHIVKDCRSSLCTLCGKKHNTKLHFEGITPNGSSLVTANNDHANPDTPSTSMHVTHHMNSQQYHVTLATAIVHIMSIDSQVVPCRAVLDSGSQISFISKACQQRLKLPTSTTSISIAGIGSITSTAIKLSPASLFSRFGRPIGIVELYSLPSITGSLPTQSINTNQLILPQYVKNELADPQFHQPQSVDLLLGADIFYELLNGHSVKLTTHCNAYHTKLGWVISGKTPISLLTVTENYFNGLSTENIPALSLFSSVSVHHQAEEIETERYFQHTWKFDEMGRFEVRLPFKQHPAALGASRAMAEHRLKHLEKKLSKKPEMDEEYRRFMREYIELGHMERVTGPSTAKPVYYLPHHAVVKINSLTTKTRVVFDASATTYLVGYH